VPLKRGAPAKVFSLYLPPDLSDFVVIEEASAPSPVRAAKLAAITRLVSRFPGKNWSGDMTKG
jgi:hypothetical protein